MLTHTSGLAVSPPSEVYQASSVRALVLASAQANPAGTFAYNNLAFHLTGMAAERAGGRPLDELAADGLFEPLGVEEWSWHRDPEGLPLCMSGLHLRATDLARIGSLHLSGGRYETREVVPPDWLAALPPGSGEVGRGCFGQYVRRGPGTSERPTRVGFGHDGYLGQWISVQPQLGIVAVRMRTTEAEADDEAEDEALAWPGFPADVHARLARPCRTNIA